MKRLICKLERGSRGIAHFRPLGRTLSSFSAFSALHILFSTYTDVTEESQLTHVSAEFEFEGGSQSQSVAAAEISQSY